MQMASHHDPNNLSSELKGFKLRFIHIYIVTNISEDLNEKNAL